MTNQGKETTINSQTRSQRTDTSGVMLSQSAQRSIGKTHPEPNRYGRYPTQPFDDRFIDEQERLKLTCVSKSTWYRWIHLGLAPEKHLIGPNSSRNLLSEVRQWMAGRRSDWPNQRLNVTR
jgi:predicted DNA-binding transcriptional regulator AlpA